MPGKLRDLFRIPNERRDLKKIVIGRKSARNLFKIGPETYNYQLSDFFGKKFWREKQILNSRVRERVDEE